VVRAVVMAGGEGTRLRPLTTALPKPLLPVANRPIVEHVLRLLRRHGIHETVLTVQYLAAAVRAALGDGSELGMDLTYATEENPLGTAGSVKNAEDELRDDTFLVISGDALTDIDLAAVVAHHRACGALATLCLTRVPDPREYGVVVLDEGGRVERFVEKPGWGQVISDTVNTGIYVLEPEVLDGLVRGEVADWSGDVFPRLVHSGAAVHGYVAEGYWEDVGTLQTYQSAQSDALDGRVAVDLEGFQVQPGVWIGEGAEIDPGASFDGPVLIGRHSKVEAGAIVRDHTVLGDNVVVRGGAFLHRATVHDTVYVGPRSNLRACVLGRGTEVLRAARIDEGAVLGERVVVEEEAVIGTGVRVYPTKVIEAGAVVRESVIFESRTPRSLFGRRGVSGIVNVEITPELVVRLAGAFATTLRKGSTVVVARDSSRAARALKRAATAALTASAIDVRDLEHAPLPFARHETARTGDAGLVIRTTPGQPEKVDLILLDSRGADLSAAARRTVDRVYERQEYRRAFPGEIGVLRIPARSAEDYIASVADVVDMRGIDTHPLRVVVDAGSGAAALLLPRLLGRLGLDPYLVGVGVNEAAPTETAAESARALVRLGELVASSGASFGVRFDRVGERLSLVDDTGRPVDDDRALLVLIDLVCAEAAGGRVALPVTATRVAEQVTAFHGVQIRWVSTEPGALEAAVRQEALLFAGDARGGFVVPEVGPRLDAFAAFARLAGLVARTRLPLSAIDARIPRTVVRRTDVETPWAVKGQVMRHVAEVAAGLGRPVDTTDGLRIIEPDGRWCLVLPDPDAPSTRLYTEATDEDAAVRLSARWAGVVQAAQQQVGEADRPAAAQPLAGGVAARVRD
jgi:mannose-1-phosphate guanylyltransferase/phosphomannomutase